jgi:HPt (histidine-containing phosphotransfer) domain-containing protein
MLDAPIDETAFAQLLETVGGDRAFLAELIETYLADSPGLLDEMRVALTADDRVALRRAAHTLKSTSSSLGALELAATCRELEGAASDAAPAELATRADEVALRYGAARAALQARLSGGATS